LFPFNEDIDLKEIGTDTLAYIGDAVVALYFKTRLIDKSKAGSIDSKARFYLSRDGQSDFMENNGEIFDEEEKEIIKRGENHRCATRHGNDPRYRRSTGFEALIGFLYLSGKRERMFEVLDNFYTYKNAFYGVIA
jgi:ribonuclease-3 family protein